MNIKTLLFTTILVTAFLAFRTHAATGDIYYVDAAHQDANDSYTKAENDEDHPWKTIQQAANVLTAGETVQVKDGTYTELVPDLFPNEVKLGLKPQNSGTAGNPITYMAYPGHQPIIDQKNQGSGFYIEGKHYLTIDGFEIKSFSRAGVWVNYGLTQVAGSSHIIVKNNLIYDGDGGGNVGGIKFDGVDSGLAQNNIIHTIRVNGDARQTNSACIHSYNMSNTIIENNELYNCGAGVYHKQAPLGREGVIIRYNIIHDIKRGAWYTNPGGLSPPHINQQFHHNIVYNTGNCLHAKTKDIPEQSDGLKVFSNTFDNCSLQTDGFLNNEFYNNIYYMDDPDPFQRQLASEDGGTLFWESDIIYSDYNNYFPNFLITMGLFGTNQADFRSLADWQNACVNGCPDTLSVAAPGPDQNGLAVDPQFVDRDNHNYKLLSTSILLDAGRFGNSMGAYTMGNEVIGANLVGINSEKMPTPQNVTATKN